MAARSRRGFGFRIHAPAVCPSLEPRFWGFDSVFSGCTNRHTHRNQTELAVLAITDTLLVLGGRQPVADASSTFSENMTRTPRTMFFSSIQGQELEQRRNIEC